MKKQLKENTKIAITFGQLKRLVKEASMVYDWRDIVKVEIGGQKFEIEDGNIKCILAGLTTLEGAPEEIERDFNCSFNRLTSLEGAPQKVGRNFECSRNRLTTLKGCPQKVPGFFDCSKNHLTSLEGGPSEVGQGFWFPDNPDLATLKGAPRKIGGNRFAHWNTDLTNEQVEAYKEFLKMSPEEQEAAGLVDETGHYNPMD